MPHLTKKQVAELERVVYDLERALKYIGQNDLVVARETRLACMPEHTFVRKSDGIVFGSLNKEVGSGLCGLGMGLRDLRSFITRHSKEG
jgi:hypothetical protein